MKKLLIIAGLRLLKICVVYGIKFWLPIEIIADSMQVYRYMNIGTDKFSAKDRVISIILLISGIRSAVYVEEFVKLAEMPWKNVLAGEEYL